IQPLVVETVFHLPQDIVAGPVAFDHGRLQGDILPGEAGRQDQFDPDTLPFGAMRSSIRTPPAGCRGS
ncbi:hypothetical protein, partial [Pseudomonas aeruginosa]|uniref:hypothetical protein n=1 Tax=Pseudomonas aeruginosa TaxID=287 RepID=UPI001969730D